jgi:lysozyme
MAAPEEAAVLPETEETAPVAEEAPAASENGEDVLAEAQIKDINGTVLLTPEEIRDALDSGTLDEESIDPTCLTGENGLLQWLWEFFFGKDEEETPQYSGWRTENGKTYYYDQNTHQPVTGIQSIDNKLYYFDASGVQQPATFGIDVSKYQSSIDWDKVKTAGVEFAIIRIGYRGYGSGALVQDPKFEEHFTNARNAGLRVGIYCFSQAVNENEAREEAQACVYVLNGRQLDYPIYFDTEASGAGNGRADGLGVEDRTKCAVAFCEEVKALGYKPGVYASTTWFRKRLDMSQLSNYYIWNAHYNVASSPIACNMWQGTCTARIPGYGGQIDVNISYMG